MSANRRTASRHTVSIPAQFVIHSETNAEAADVIICNLSLGGAQLIFDRRLSMGQRGQLTFEVPGHAKPIEIGTTVRWAADGYLGVQFAGLRARDVWAINRYLATVDSADSAAGEATTDAPGVDDAGPHAIGTG